MFKNRSVQIKFVKDSPQDQQTALPPSYSEISVNPEYIINAATDLGAKAVKGAAILMITYMAVDTLRQVIIKSTVSR